MLDWLRYVTGGGIRLRHERDVSGAKFSLAGKLFDLRATGERARDEIIELAYKAARGVLGRPVRVVTDRRRLERQIVEATWRGDVLAADRLTRELVMTNERTLIREHSYVPLGGHGQRNQAPFGKRQAW